jgi:hypothetical protein
MKNGSWPAVTISAGWQPMSPSSYTAAAADPAYLSIIARGRPAMPKAVFER